MWVKQQVITQFIDVFLISFGHLPKKYSILVGIHFEGDLILLAVSLQRLHKIGDLIELSHVLETPLEPGLDQSREVNPLEVVDHLGRPGILAHNIFSVDGIVLCRNGHKILEQRQPCEYLLIWVRYYFGGDGVFVFAILGVVDDNIFPDILFGFVHGQPDEPPELLLGIAFKVPDTKLVVDLQFEKFTSAFVDVYGGGAFVVVADLVGIVVNEIDLDVVLYFEDLPVNLTVGGRHEGACHLVLLVVVVEGTMYPVLLATDVNSQPFLADPGEILLKLVVVGDQLLQSISVSLAEIQGGKLEEGRSVVLEQTLRNSVLLLHVIHVQVLLEELSEGVSFAGLDVNVDLLVLDALYQQVLEVFVSPGSENKFLQQGLLGVAHVAHQVGQYVAQKSHQLFLLEVINYGCTDEADPVDGVVVGVDQLGALSGEGI